MSRPVVLYDASGTAISAATPLAVQSAAAQNAALSSVAAVTTSVTLQAANSARKGLCAFNESTGTLYVAYADTASTSRYTLKVGPGAFWEMDLPVYTGVVTGIWDSANGAARMTEKS